MPWKVLSDEDVEEIREVYASGYLYLEELAERYGVSRTHIGYLVDGSRREDAPGPILGEDYELKRPGRPNEKAIIS